MYKVENLIRESIKAFICMEMVKKRKLSRTRSREMNRRVFLIVQEKGIHVHELAMETLELWN
ncbi:hypothetical protein ACJIZ3_014087 [Penstemon smallii]|uniref:Ribosomal protein L22 n=1 Tax=Penstemon smallii TaxID=265156 RepID=A0ABD3RJ94_9LAMI